MQSAYQMLMTLQRMIHVRRRCPKSQWIGTSIEHRDRLSRLKRWERVLENTVSCFGAKLPRSSVCSRAQVLNFDVANDWPLWRPGVCAGDDCQPRLSASITWAQRTFGSLHA